MVALPREDTTSPGSGSPLLRIGYYLGVLLAALFLIVSIISWSLLLGLCSLVLAVVLFRNIDVVGGNARTTRAAVPSPPDK